MIESRCPWCGESLEGARKPKIAFDRYEMICPVCQKSVTRLPANRINGIFVITFLLGIGLVTLTPIGVWVMGVSGCLIILLQPLGPARRSDRRFATPVARLDEYIGDYKQSARVEIQWRKSTEGGLWWPWINLSKGTIVPISRVNGLGKYERNTWCIRLESQKVFDIRHFVINVVDEEVPEDFLKEGARFLVYNKEKVIGEMHIL